MYLRPMAREATNLYRFLILRTRWTSSSSSSSSSSKGVGEGFEKAGDVVLPAEPTHCCMSGCPNCVWIKYAQELAEKFDNGDVIAKQKISEKVKDPTLREFLFTSLGLKDREIKPMA